MVKTIVDQWLIDASQFNHANDLHDFFLLLFLKITVPYAKLQWVMMTCNLSPNQQPFVMFLVHGRAFRLRLIIIDQDYGKKSPT